MPTLTKKNTVKKETIRIQIGKRFINLVPMPAAEVAMANARIQKKVQPILSQIKKTRKAAAITASRIILSA